MICNCFRGMLFKASPTVICLLTISSFKFPSLNSPVMINTFLKKKASHFQGLSSCSPIRTSYNLKIKMGATEKTIHWNFKITKSAWLKTMFNYMSSLCWLPQVFLLHLLLCVVRVWFWWWWFCLFLFCLFGFFIITYLLYSYSNISISFHLVMGNYGTLPPAILSCLFSEYLLFWMDDLSIQENSCV